MADDEDPSPSRRGPLIAIIVVVALMAGAWWAMSSLRSTSAIQDCAMSGRTNCAPIDSNQR